MPIIRKFAVQGHAVPSTAHSPRGPFPPEVLAQPRMDVGDYHSDSLHVGLDDVRFFRCRECDDIMLQDELDTHECED
jgi:hypothetical protein